MEWDAPAIVLDARPYGEGDAIATVMTAEHGAHRGLARGGAARSRTAIWQPGNLVQAVQDAMWQLVYPNGAA